MKFEDKVRKHLGKKLPEGGIESFKRKNLLAIIENKVGILSSINFNKADTADLFRLVNALTKEDIEDPIKKRKKSRL